MGVSASKYVKDIMEVLTMQDGQFNEEISAYVTAYACGEDQVAVELEYVDPDDDEDMEIVQVKKFTIVITED